MLDSICYSELHSKFVSVMFMDSERTTCLCTSRGGGINSFDWHGCAHPFRSVELEDDLSLFMKCQPDVMTVALEY